MSAVVQIDAGTHATDAEDVLYQERLKIRDNMPLPVLVGTCEILLETFQSDFAVFIQSIPEVDPKTLDPDRRNCPVCWDDYNTQSKHDPSTHSEHDRTSLRLPCAHHVCKACAHDLLPRTGTCPVCRQQFGPQNDNYPTVEHEQYFLLREPYEAIAEITPIFLASNRKNDSFGEFALWLFADESNDPDALQTRAQLAMNIFQGFTFAFVEVMRHEPTGREWLEKLRVGIIGRGLMKDSNNEDEVGSDGENSDTNTAAATVGEGEDFMDMREDANPAAATVAEEEDSMDENEDADRAAAALGEEEKDPTDEGEEFDEMGDDEDEWEEDPTDEGEDFDEMGDDEDDWGYEIEAEEQHTLVTVLGCAALISMVGIGLLMSL